MLGSKVGGTEPEPKSEKECGGGRSLGGATGEGSVLSSQAVSSGEGLCAPPLERSGAENMVSQAYLPVGRV